MPKIELIEVIERGLPGDLVPHTHRTSDVTTGVFDIARLPTHLSGWTFSATIAGRYFGPHSTFLGRTSYETLTATANRTYGIPLYIPVGMTIDVIRFEILTAVAGSAAIGGIYDSNSFGFATGNPLATTASIATDTTGIKDAGLSVTVAGGNMVWLAVVFSHAVAFQGFQPARTPLQMLTGSGSVVMAGLFRNGASFALSTPNATFTPDHALLQVRTA